MADEVLSRVWFQEAVGYAGVELRNLGVEKCNQRST